MQGETVISYSDLCSNHRFDLARKDAEKQMRKSRSKRRNDPFDSFIWVVSYRDTCPDREKYPEELQKPSWRVCIKDETSKKDMFRTISELYCDDGEVDGNWSF